MNSNDLARDIHILNKLLREARVVGTKRYRRKPGTTRSWILKHLSARPIKTADFMRKAAADGYLHATVYQVLIRMIDEGFVSEDRYKREIWKP